MGTNVPDWSFSALTDTIIDSLDESSSITNSRLKGEVSGCTALSVNGSTKLNPTMPSFIQDECHMSGENELNSLKRAHESVTKTNYMEEEIWACSQWGNNVELFGDTSTELGSYYGENMTEQQLGGTATGHNAVKNVNDFFTFPSESELHKVLGSIACRQTAKSVSEFISIEDTYSSPTMISNKEEYDHTNGLEFPKEIDPEYLLDDLVSNLCSAADDTSSISNSVRSPITKPIELTNSIQPNVTSEESTLIVKSSDMRSNLMPAVIVKGRDDFTNHFTSPSFGENSGLLIDESQSEKVYGQMQPLSGPKSSSTSKKRAKVGNSQRSRPRDRQLIMDRMKELRELVPDVGRVSFSVYGPKLI